MGRARRWQPAALALTVTPPSAGERRQGHCTWKGLPRPRGQSWVPPPASRAGPRFPVNLPQGFQGIVEPVLEREPQQGGGGDEGAKQRTRGRLGCGGAALPSRLRPPACLGGQEARPLPWTSQAAQQATAWTVSLPRFQKAFVLLPTDHRLAGSVFCLLLWVAVSRQSLVLAGWNSAFKARAPVWGPCPQCQPSHAARARRAGRALRAQDTAF